MRILFVHPPKNAVSLVPSYYEPLAFETLASTVPDSEIDFVDMRFERWAALHRRIAEFRPHIVGMSVNNTIDVNQTIAAVRFMKKLEHGLKIVVGGRHPSLVPHDFFLPEIDAVFVGWAERSFPRYIALAQSRRDGADVPGIIHIHDGKPRWPSALFDEITDSDIPMPDRSLSKKYWKHYVDEIGRRIALVNTTRGCPFRCVFCACWKSVNGQYFARSAESVFAELSRLPPGIRFVSFADDNSFQDSRRAWELYHLIRGSGLRHRYSAYARADSVANNRDLFRSWQRIGLRNLVIGFEAARSEALAAYNKRSSHAVNREAARVLDDLGLSYGAYYLVDPDFERADFAELLRTVRRMRVPKPRFVVLTPLPGTPLHDRKSKLIDRGYEYFDFMHWVYPPRLGDREFFRMFSRLYRKTNSLSHYGKMITRCVYHLVVRGTVCRDQITFRAFIRRWVMALPLRKRIFRQYFGRGDRRTFIASAGKTPESESSP